MEVVGGFRVENFDLDGVSKPVVVVSFKVNVNQKSKTLEETLEQRKVTVRNAAANMRKEVRFDLRLVSGAPPDLEDFDERIQELMRKTAEWFNSDTNFQKAVRDIIKCKDDAITANVKALGAVPNVSSDAVCTVFSICFRTSYSIKHIM